MWGADVALSWALIPTHTSPLGKKSWRSHMKVVEKGSLKEVGEKAKQKHNSFHIWLVNDKWPCHVYWLRAHYIILQQEIPSEKTLCCLRKSLGWIQHWNTALKAASGSPARVRRLDTALSLTVLLFKHESPRLFQNVSDLALLQILEVQFRADGCTCRQAAQGAPSHRLRLLEVGLRALRQNGSRLLHLLLFPEAVRPTYRKKPCLGTSEFSSPAWHGSSV